MTESVYKPGSGRQNIWSYKVSCGCCGGTDTDRHKFLTYSVAYYYDTMKHFYVMTKFWVWVRFVKGRVNDVCHEINYMKIISPFCVRTVCVVRKGG